MIGRLLENKVFNSPNLSSRHTIWVTKGRSSKPKLSNDLENSGFDKAFEVEVPKSQVFELTKSEFWVTIWITPDVKCKVC